MKKFTLRQKTIVLVGASQGLGRAMALQLAAMNNKLLLIARSQDKLQSIQKQCRELGADTEIFVCDIGDPSALSQCLNQIDQASEIDSVICNAAMCHMVSEVEYDSFRQHTEVNYLAHVRIISFLLPKFRRRNAGQIIVINSVTAFTPMPIYIAYGTSKAALRCFLRSLRLNLRDTNIWCQQVYPGFIDTELLSGRTHPRPFQKTAEEMARLIIQKLEKGRREIYIPGIVGLGARIANRLATPIYHFIFSKHLLGKYFDPKYHP